MKSGGSLLFQVDKGTVFTFSTGGHVGEAHTQVCSVRMKNTMLRRGLGNLVGIFSKLEDINCNL